MSKSRPHLLILLVALSAVVLLACETTNLIGQSAQPRPSNRSQNAPTGNPTRDPAEPYEFVPLDQPRCSAGDFSASIISGNITRDGVPAFGQQVVVTASPGSEEVNIGAVQADENGNFQVGLFCSTGACFGSYVLWLVNDESQQVSPAIEYIFDDNCQRGTVNFGSP